MSRWNAPSDRDYWEDVEGRSHDGLERTCQECGEPVMVSRSEGYQIHVFHAACLDRIAQRLKRRTLKAALDGQRAKGEVA